MLIDGLAFGAMPDIVAAAKPPYCGWSRLVIIRSHSRPASIGRPRRHSGASEKRATACRVPCRGDEPRDQNGLSRYDVAADASRSPNRAPIAHRQRRIRVRDVALLLRNKVSVVPTKASRYLIEALAAIPERNWRLTCAGSRRSRPRHGARLR